MHDLQKYMTAKKAGQISRARKDLSVKPNGRSADFIIPSFAVGCGLVCTYCYVSRHRPLGNPIEQLTNTEEIWKSVKAHYESLGPKISNQCDPTRWTYDIGESTDCLLPQNIDNTLRFIKWFLTETEAKPTFATKLANHSALLPLLGAYKGRARVRMSLMPQRVSSLVEPVTSPISQRIDSINELVAKHYEVHINLSPVILYPGWEHDYYDLLKTLQTRLSPEALSQLKAEVILLTHHPKLHELNMQWAPEAENILWAPNLQETKTTQRGDAQVVRYKALTVKSKAINTIKTLVYGVLPECDIRYIF